jgi:NAD(P)-dependent dehydrogenase (short-subunit alcohol dehydrogenase family)
MFVRSRIWVVTGGGSGLGRELVLQLLDRGARVAAVDVRAEPLAETARLAGAGDRLSTHVADIADQEAVSLLPEAVVHAHGAVDGLINNAGIIQPFDTVDELDDSVGQRVLDVNLRGTLAMCRAFLPLLRQRPVAHLVNVSSMGGVFPFPGQTVYGASKAGVKLLTEGLYAELRDTPVAVSVVIPGAMQTGIVESSGVAAPAAAGAGSRMPLTPADEAARIIIDGIECNRLHIYVGKDALLLGLAIRVMPRTAINLIQDQMKKMLAQPERADAPS